MTVQRLFICDLDGTACVVDHRRHLVDGKIKDWEQFHDLCEVDPPNVPVITTLSMLHSAGAEIWFFTGRPERLRSKTEKWLRQHIPSITTHPSFDFWTHLMMRQNDDFTEDHILKVSWLNSMLDIDRSRLVAVFDDRDSVVKGWRANGVSCFQVAPGNF
jgi:hypothetical protein